MFTYQRLFLRSYLSNLSIRGKLHERVRHFCFKKDVEWTKRVFSGIQPSGILHVGNYFGAVQNWVKLQEESDDILYCVADLHSMTLPWNPEELNSNILLTAATLLACGIDPEKCILFQQSKVHQHAELCWVLSCLSTMARLAQLPQYKEKKDMVKDVPLGLFSYPVLQAADILLYKSTHVPVGEDQEQNLRVGQVLARMFNKRFGATFPIPNALIEGNDSSRIRSLREPNRKMSKSHTDSKSRIELTDTPDRILEKVKKAVTDCTSHLSYEPETRPGVANLIVLYSLATNKTCEDVCSDHVHIDTGAFKILVADALISLLNPIREKINYFCSSPDYLENVLEDGNIQATEIAEKTWSEVKQRVGIDISNKGQRLNNLANFQPVK